MLQVKGLSVSYGAVAAVRGVDLQVNSGEVVALIGANGAGKSSILRAISGLVKPSLGSILFEGVNIAGTRADKITDMGLSQVPEGRAVLARMTVVENLQMGAYCRADSEVAADLEKVLARFPRLAERKHQLAGTLSGGEQQMLVMGRALMARPRLLLLDEPSMGLAPLVVAEVLKLVREINQQGTTVLLVEQNARQALKIAHRAYVLETGKVVLAGSAAELAADARVAAAYLGGRKG
ncbi:MAG TPA: ABC transporter ATP-binding protein [Symbiobacteriaceae bacterium]|jgi:branched-chain amino acid transport system ATP-binding protein